LLAHLAEAAAEEVTTVFVAITLPGNHRMIGVFRDSGFPASPSRCARARASCTSAS
jgi:hypothetical protein